jgi:CheY-like chemotaxis protein
MTTDVPDTHPRALRLLLAEDHPVNARVCLSVIGRLGHTADVARDGKEAVDRWASGGYDAILMDIRMPVTDGIEAAVIIRAREAGGPDRIPIIALTVEEGPGLRERLESAGFDDILTKPVEPLLVTEALARHVTNCRKKP